MAFIVITMLVIVVVAGLVVAFVAFPHRGEEMPGAPWLGEAMDRASGAVPTIDPEQDERARARAARAGPRGVGRALLSGSPLCLD